MYSAEGEEVQLSFSIYPSSNVEDWLREVERSMKTSMRDIIERAIKAYPLVSHASYPSTASKPGDPSVYSFVSVLCSIAVAGLPACFISGNRLDCCSSVSQGLLGAGVLAACSGRNLKTQSRN